MRSPRRTGAASRFGRALGYLTILLVFAGSAFLLTCQKRPTSLNAVPPSSNQRSSERATSISPDRASEAQTRRSGTAEPKHTIIDSAGEKDETRQQTPTATADSAARPAHKQSPAAGTKLGEVARGGPGGGMIALTFDAGADPSPTGEILDALAKHGVHATFFLTGKWVKKNPELVRRIAAEGHEIGNHTYSHRRLTELTDAQIGEEVEKTDSLVVELTGRSTKPLLRVPYGSRDARVLEVLRNLGYRSIYWDVDCWDAVKPNYTSADIRKRVLSKIGGGSIVLMHCGSRATADGLDSLLDKLEAEGYHQVMVSELLGNR